MKTLNEKFTDQEFDNLTQAKNWAYNEGAAKKRRTWHDFILASIHYEELEVTTENLVNRLRDLGYNANGKEQNLSELKKVKTE
jgi:hypothetical protein